MIFTIQDLEKVRKYLVSVGIRDKELPKKNSDSLSDNDVLIVTSEDGKEYQVSARDFGTFIESAHIVDAKIDSDKGVITLVRQNGNEVVLDTNIGVDNLNKIVSSLKADLTSNKEEVINKLNQHIEQADKDTLAIRNDISDLKDKDTTLEGSISKEITDRKDADKDIIDNKIPEAISKVVADAPEKFDTLKEIADYIKSDETRAAQIISLVDEMHKALEREVITLDYDGYKDGSHIFTFNGSAPETKLFYYRMIYKNFSESASPYEMVLFRDIFFRVKYTNTEDTPNGDWLSEDKVYIFYSEEPMSPGRATIYTDVDGKMSIEPTYIKEADASQLLKVDTEFDSAIWLLYYLLYAGNAQLQELVRDTSNNEDAIESLEKVINQLKTNKTTVNLYTGLSDVQSKMEPLDEGSIAIFILFDLSGKGTLDANTSQQLLGKNEVTGFSSGDLLIMAKYNGGQLGMIIPTQDVKSKVGSFPGAMGLASPDDKLRIESIPQLYAGENFVPGSYNADQCLEPGTYFKMTTGRSMTPNDDDETYLLVVTPRKTYDNGYQNAMQIAYSLKYAGKSHYRYIEFNPDKQFTKFTDWNTLTSSLSKPASTSSDGLMSASDKKTLDSLSTSLSNISDYTEEYIDAWFEEEDYVDLGLPSGTLWATRNIGAATKYDAGLYFQWGDTQGYTAKQIKNGEKVFDWDHYKYGKLNSSDTQNYGMTKYNKTDGKAVLENSDDAAFVATNGKFKMPTLEQIKELMNNTNNTIVTDNNGKYVKFTNKTDESKFIVLPAVGGVENRSLYSVDMSGSYWLSTVEFPDASFARQYYFYTMNSIGMLPPRCEGHSIRGVLNK